MYVSGMSVTCQIDEFAPRNATLMSFYPYDWWYCAYNEI